MAIEEAAPRETTSAGVGSIGPDVATFGSRPSNGRPHSMSLHRPVESTADEGARGLDLLVGIGIGAALMYYLDPAGGEQRRTLVRDQVLRAIASLPARADGIWLAASPPSATLAASAIGGALSVIAAKRRDGLGAALALLGSALLGTGAREAQARDATRPSEMSLEPRSRELGDAVERPGLLKEM